MKEYQELWVMKNRRTIMMPELDTIKIGQPAQRALKEIGINTIMQLCNYTERELLAIHGIGPKAVRILKDLLAKEGLSYKE